MPIKDLLHRFQPIPLYTVLVLSICYFSVQLVFSHLTHALTLLMSSYHMLCNILALAGCIVTIKRSKGHERDEASRAIADCSGSGGGGGKSFGIDEHGNVMVVEEEEQALAKRDQRNAQEQRLRNTFGWARIDILTMLIVFIILASLSFSLIVEALQTLVHIDHQDCMHMPVQVIILGCAGLILNGLTYFLIGGYTLHQGSFLHLTPGGNVVLDRAMSTSGDLNLKPMQRQLSGKRKDKQLKECAEQQHNAGSGDGDGDGNDGDEGNAYFATKREGWCEIFRDISSTLFVILCAGIVYAGADEESTAKFVDPILSIISCVLLVTLSYPYMRESCLILLQTIPGSIDMEIFERTLVTKFPQIVSYHDLHIWQLAAHSYVATIHIKFQNPQLYSQIIEDVRNYFHDQGIAAVTIQPEFHSRQTHASQECLMQCSAPDCLEKVCCRDSRTDLRDVVSTCPVGKDAAFKETESAPVMHEKPNELNVTQLMKLKKPATITVSKQTKQGSTTINQSHSVETEAMHVHNGNGSGSGSSSSDSTKDELHLNAAIIAAEREAAQV